MHGYIYLPTKWVGSRILEWQWHLTLPHARLGFRGLDELIRAAAIPACCSRKRPCNARKRARLETRGNWPQTSQCIHVSDSSPSARVPACLPLANSQWRSWQGWIDDMYSMNKDWQYELVVNYVWNDKLATRVKRKKQILIIQCVHIVMGMYSRESRSDGGKLTGTGVECLFVLIIQWTVAGRGPS